MGCFFCFVFQVSLLNKYFSVNRPLKCQRLSAVRRLHLAVLNFAEIHGADGRAVTVRVTSGAWRSRTLLSEALNSPSNSLSDQRWDHLGNISLETGRFDPSDVSRRHLLLCIARLSQRKLTEYSSAVRQRNAYYVKTVDDGESSRRITSPRCDRSDELADSRAVSNKRSAMILIYTLRCHAHSRSENWSHPPQWSPLYRHWASEENLETSLKICCLYPCSVCC